MALGLERYRDARRLPTVRLVEGAVTNNHGMRGSRMNPVLRFGNVADIEGAFDQQRLFNARILARYR